MNNILVVDTETLYALLEGMELVRVDMHTGITAVGWPIKDKIATLDKDTFFMRKFLNIFQIGDKHGYWQHIIGQELEWKYTEFKDEINPLG